MAKRSFALKCVPKRELGNETPPHPDPLKRELGNEKTLPHPDPLPSRG